MNSTPLQIPRLDCRTDDIDSHLAELQKRLSPDGDIVSPRGRELTMKVFGEALSPRHVVERICEDVHQEGTPALIRYTQQLDKAEYSESDLRVSPDQLSQAHANVDRQFLEAVRAVRDNIQIFQQSILHQSKTIRPRLGVQLTQRYTPLDRVGICVPGGAAAYPSTVLMTAVAAQAAGVEQLAVVAPPTPFGSYNDEVLATCHELGITEVYRVGGAQAVAALAYGVDQIPGVNKIVGPGNLFVALAKKHVFGHVDIDSIAGPSEVLIIADQSANPSFIAADLLAQAEHSPGSAILLTWDDSLIDRVVAELDRHLASLTRADLTMASLNQFSSLICVEDVDHAVRLANKMAPEHLHVQTANPSHLVPRLTTAGALFAGHLTPVALGDYVAGPSHVLPTGSTAHWASGLSSNDFLRSSSVISYDRKGLESDARHVQLLADREGLPAHRLSVDLRLDETE